MEELTPSESIPSTQDAIDAANALTESLNGLKGEISIVNKRGRRTRSLLNWLFLSIFLDIVLSAFLAIAFVKLDNANEQVEKNAVNTTQACMSGNESRRTQVELWGTIFSVIGENRLPEIPTLKARVNQVFAQRVCP